jgi:predicted deacylase
MPARPLDLVREDHPTPSPRPPDPPAASTAPPGSSPGETVPGPTPTPTVAEGEARVIGTSVVGRPLTVFQFGRGAREVMIAAGIHGGYEWNTIALADALIGLLRREPERVPSDTTLFILRALNPDGEARSHSYAGRANENGVDLNRNWPVNWHPDWNRDSCWAYLPITGGPHPASEPEVRAVMAFVLDHDLEALISYHSAALGIFPGGEPPDLASQRLAEAIAAVSGYRYPPLDYGCEYTGGFVDWATSLGIAAVDLELTTHASLDYDVNLKVLETFLNWRP